MDDDSPRPTETQEGHPRHWRALVLAIGFMAVGALIGSWVTSSGGLDTDQAGGVALLPDPWTVDDRFDCYGGSTADVRRCTFYDRAAAEANLQVVTEVLARERDLVELRDSTKAWAEDVDLLCQLSATGGSVDRYGIPYCFRRAAELRAEFLGVFDHWGNLPPSPVDLWDTPIDRFDDGACSARLTGTVVAEPRGYTVVSQTSAVDLVLHEGGTVTGKVEMSVELQPGDDTQMHVESTDRLYGEMGIKAGGGVYVGQVQYSGEDPVTNYGYWWIEVGSASAEGGMLALFASDARSDLKLSVAPC